MPADSKHKLYKRYSSIYTMIYDCKEGERAIKEAGETYLPKLGGQTNTSYAAYKSRGAFLNATGRTITALTGLMMRKDAVVEAPKELEEDFDNITSDNLSLQQLLMECCESSLSYSRQGLLIDADEKGDNPFIAVYNALSILNWRSTFVNGEEVLTMLTLKETAVEVDKEDEFKTNEIEQVRVLTLDKEDDEVREAALAKIDDPKFLEEAAVRGTMYKGYTRHSLDIALNKLSELAKEGKVVDKEVFKNIEDKTGSNTASQYYNEMKIREIDDQDELKEVALHKPQ